MPKVGDIIYKFDQNRRVYRRDEKGRAQGGPIYTEYFVPFKIIGETKRSWLSGDDGQEKVNKETMRSAGRGGFHGYQWFTEEGKTSETWRDLHRINIADMVRRESDVSKLRQIASILGYVESGAN